MRSPIIRLMCLFVLTGLWAMGAAAQVAPEQVQLNWTGHEAVLPTATLPGKIPVFEGASYDYAERLPYYRLQFRGTTLSSFQLQETAYEPFSADDQKLFQASDIATEPAITIVPATENKVPVALVMVLPIRKNPQSGQLEKLVRFSYSYTTQNNTRLGTTDTRDNHTTTSVLNTGNWYKLAVTASGIYKIDRATLQALGISTQGLDPRTIQVFGNGGGMLPQPNNIARPDDLTENAIWVVGEADGRFDEADYALFYAQGPHTWSYDANQKLFTHENNIYSDTAFYFLRVGAAPGTRISSRGQAAGATQTITSYNERLFHERDLKSMIYSGREWYGEEFSSFTSSRDIAFPVTDLVPGSEIRLTAALMANSSVITSFVLRINNQNLGTQAIAGRGSFVDHPEGTNSLRTYTINQQTIGAAQELRLNLAYNTGGSSTSAGYINYLELNLERQLRLYGEQTSFRSISSLEAGVSTYRVAAAPANAMVWDVTDPLRPVLQEVVASGPDLSFSATSSTLREYVVFQNNTGLKPIPAGRVANQNLHAQNLNGDLDLVILTHPNFIESANRLAEHRNQHSGMNVVVVTPNQVYNEFSSGRQDVTAIRDYMRMLYKRSSKSGSEVMHLLLFGDTSYDYKNRIANNTNFIPVYQSRQSLNPITSYSSEDYYGFLDDTEGEWVENTFGDHLLDIGVGRLPAKTAAEAATLVNKIMLYDSPSHFGKWRSRITFAADDGDFNLHQNDAEFLANYIENSFTQYNTNKIYLDLYRQVSVSNGQRAPQATEAFNKAVEQGSLIINYTGHGNAVSLASEQLVTLENVANWRNINNLTFLVTATCEFGRYDDPARVSGAETALLNQEGGAVGLLTTTRKVYQNGNKALNTAFFESAFTPIDGKMPVLGDLLQRTKNNSIVGNASGARGVNNRNFTLLGDPSQQLAYANLKATITEVNGMPATTDTLRALSKVNFKGKVSEPSGAVAAGFNGKINITVFDKQNTLMTFGDEGVQSIPVKLRENVIYDGQATVTNGLFEVNFVVPKDIAYNYGPGKVSLYASNSSTDALGASKDVIVGGTATDVAEDNIPPVINIFMDDESFVFGGTTGKNPLLLAKIFDDNGINTAGLGIGHEITAIFNDAKDNLTVLNDYYTADVDSYQSGTVRFQLQNLKPGPHSVRLKAWDTHNNSAEEYLEFVVSNEAGLALDHVLNHPNPFSTRTTFHFDHNRAGENLEIQVQIFTISGKLVKTLETTCFASKTHLAEITWNGRDEYNDTLAKGVYVYKVNVRSQQDGSKTSKFEKLVILN
ncbi:type IX secretion system sortase PorU [Pontibacter qinzhouensis]|uniref:Type IX secretion system sortase PorU n=2 Tax=Pontibacter qinzhouensis TaxID=2603253 RepID=A0A5C8KA71_9BACT|nr:type IX secretion system sortase PorU [Pontibacter qinzhouensis]